MICLSTEALFEEHAPEATRLAQSFFRRRPRLHDRLEVEDVVQEALAALARACEAYRHGESQSAPAGFLMRAVMNALHSVSRQQRRRKRTPHAQLVSDRPAPAHFDTERELRDLIRRTELAPTARGLLFATLGLAGGRPRTPQELAEALLIPQQQVELLLRQSHQQLQAVLLAVE